MGPSDEAKAEFLNDTGEVHAVWFGFLTAVGLIDLTALVPDEIENLYVELHYFCLGAIIAVVAIASLIGAAVGLSVALALDLWTGLLAGATVAAYALLVLGAIILPRCKNELMARGAENRMAVVEDIKQRLLGPEGDDEH